MLLDSSFNAQTAYNGAVSSFRNAYRAANTNTVTELMAKGSREQIQLIGALYDKMNGLEDRFTRLEQRLDQAMKKTP